jgi:hypothetical protein
LLPSRGKTVFGAAIGALFFIEVSAHAMIFVVAEVTRKLGAV